MQRKLLSMFPLKIILIGGGGHCASIIDALLSLKQYELVGIVDTDTSKLTLLGVPFVGTDHDLRRLYRQGIRHACITIGSVGDPSRRMEAARLAGQIGYQFPVIAHPSATVSPNARIGKGSYVGAGAVIGPRSRIGSHCIINTGAIVEHDCSLGAFVHIAPGAVLGGGVVVGRTSHVGINCSIVQGCSIGAGTLIGAGSAVVGDISRGIVAFGNPCRTIRKNTSAR